jgi:myo-inositol 2-dehydrogenase/D-chiro-inositol 1-dehydrogenase
VNIAVIGAGRIGKIHAENLASRIPGARLAGVADVNEGAAQSLAAQLHAPRATGDYHAFLNDTAVDAVAICSSTDTHGRIICEAAAAGKQIFCEKPIDHDLQRIHESLDAVSKAGVILQVGFNRRFDPGFAKARELVATGKVGRVHLVRVTSRDPGPPPIDYVKVSGGMFLDMTIHDFDMVRFLSGSEAVDVHAVGSVLVDPAIGEAGDIDTAVITMRMANGAIATIDNSRKAIYGYDQRVEVFGSAGMVQVANRTPENHVHFAADGVHTSKPLHFFLERYQEAYLLEMQQFIQAVATRTAPPVCGHDGLVPVLMALAAARSMREGRTVAMRH